MISENPRSVFAYCTNWDYESILSAIQRRNQIARVCFVTTQTHRLYAVVTSRGLSLSPYERYENQWISVKLSDRIITPTPQELFETPEHMKDTLTELFFRQFPKAEESYFDRLPTSDSIISLLTSSPFGRTMDSNFLIYSQDGETEVEDADGIVTILTEEGDLMIPYDKVSEDGIPDIKLQMYRAKLHPDSYPTYVGEKVWDRLEEFKSRLRDLSWSRFRRFVDRIIK